MNEAIQLSYCLLWADLSRDRAVSLANGHFDDDGSVGGTSESTALVLNYVASVLLHVMRQEYFITCFAVS